MARTKTQLVASIDTAVDAQIRAIAACGGTISAFVNEALVTALQAQDSHTSRADGTACRLQHEDA